jgi:hypothetical protein
MVYLVFFTQNNDIPVKRERDKGNRLFYKLLVKILIYIRGNDSMIKIRNNLAVVLVMGLVLPFSPLIPNVDSLTIDHPAIILYPEAVDDSFEDDDSFETAGSFTLNSKEIRSIYPIADPDFVVFELNSYHTVTIKTNETIGDTRIWLYDYSRNQINFDDNSVDDLNATIKYAYLKPGFYFVKVEETGNDAEIDSYSLSIEATLVIDPYESDDCPSSTVIYLNSSITKSIYPSDNWDFFTFTIPTSYNITVETFGSYGDTVIDIRTVCDEDGTVFDFNDDKGDGTLFSKLTQPNLAPGTYYVKVSAYNDLSPVYNYTLHLRANSSSVSDTQAPIFHVHNLVLTEDIGPSAANIYTILSDDFGISEVILHYRVNSGSWDQVDMMLFNYRNYTGSIGPFDVGDFVEYYFTAKDDSSNHNSAIADNGGSYYNFTILNIEFVKPIIEQVHHIPTIPNEIETATINCTITDDSGVQSASLYYRVNNGDWSEQAMTYDTNDIYLATIGPFNYDDYIDYYVTAIDNSAYHNIATNNNSGLYYRFEIAASDTTPPVITNVAKDIENPYAGQVVNVTCTVTDTSGIKSVILYYRINSGFFEPMDMILISGNTYKATFDSLIVGSFIEYYIKAIDNSSIQNDAVNDNNGDYYSFTVGASPITNNFVLFLFPTILAATLLSLAKKKKSKK